MDVNQKFGPLLRDVFGRKVAVKKFAYSYSMGGKRGTFRWSKQKLYKFLGIEILNFRGS
jgi:cytochrome c2